jgi:hypothetical protein
MDNEFDNDFNEWLEELEQQEQPTACDIGDHECDSCGS